MKIQKLYWVSSLFLVLALAGCKLMDDNRLDDEARQRAASRLPNNSPPVIWGTPERAVMVQGQYHFEPEASDSDGDLLEYQIVNKPGWAQFDAMTGTLHGVPQARHVGRYQDVVISVTDGNSVSSLPGFTVTVREPTQPSGDDEPGGGSSSPPVIEGNPNKSVAVDSMYSFQPDASDPDGDALSFSIVNKPSWAAFETTSGLLEGKPGAGDVGTSEPIEISVTDGVNIAALGEFTITVETVGTASLTVEWNAPTENQDGSPLTDLSGYRIYFGAASGKYGAPIDVPGGMTSFVVENITPGTYYLAMTSVNSQGMESDKTDEITFEIGS